MSLEVRIPVSPTPSFLNRVRLLAASFRRFYPDTIVRAYVGQETVTEVDECHVREAFVRDNIAWEWVSGREFMAWDGTGSPYLATMNRRWSLPVEGDIVVIADADILLVRDLGELFDHDAVQGVQAHVSPLSDDEWRYLFAIMECQPPLFQFLYSGAGIMEREGRLGPWYVNSGFVTLPKAHFEAMVPEYHRAIGRIRGAMGNTYWADQLALAIAACRSGVPRKQLPVSYNFPNQADFDSTLPACLHAVRVLHYLREDAINRTRDFADVAALRRLVARADLTGSNEVLRQHIAGLMGCLEPPLWRGEPRNMA